MSKRWAAGLAGAVLFPWATAQTPPAPPQEGPVIRVTVSLVQIDAIVTDRNGRQVTDLKAQDFEILQDGRPQKITHFSYVRTGEPARPPVAPAPSLDPVAPPPAPTRPRPDQVRRSIALLVDDLGLSFESMEFVRQALKKFVDQQMQPGDLAAVLLASRGMGAFQQFTSDKEVLRAAIERVRWNMLGTGGVSAFAPFQDDPLEEAAEGLAADTGPRPARDIEEIRQEYFSVGTLGALDYVVRGLRDLPGRKSIVLFSDGMRILTADGSTDRVLEALERLGDSANRAAVAIYTVDARGLPTLSLTAEDRVGRRSANELLRQRRQAYFNSQDGLHLLAERTGGVFTHSSNDLSDGVSRALEDMRGYYLLGYNPGEETFKTKAGRLAFHRIKVRVKRPGLEVRSRTGFYGVPDDQARPERRTRQQQLFDALNSPFAGGGIRLRLTSLFGNRPDGSFLQSLLHMDARDFAFTPEAEGWQKAALDVLVITFGEQGAVVDQTSRTYTVRLRGDGYKLALQRGLVYNIYHPVKKPGAYQMRVAVRDGGSEKVGSANQFVRVPDLTKGRLTLSGIAVTAGKQAVAQQAEGQVDDTGPQATPALRIFRAGDTLYYGLQIYNAQVDRAAGRPQLETHMRVYREGKRIYTTKPEAMSLPGQTDWKRIRAGGRLEFSKGIMPGEYVIQVVITDKLAKEKQRTATQWIDFEILP